MKNKLRDYIDSIFADAPICSKTIDLKEEMYRNVCDRYDDLIADGKTESAAYNICIAGIGDVSEIIEGLRAERGEEPAKEIERDPVYNREYSYEEREKIEKYRVKSGIMNAVAIALYILCWVPLVLLSEIGALGNVGEILGLTVMMVMIAVATALMCMKSAIKPSFMKNKDIDENGETVSKKEKKEKEEKKRRNPILKAINGVIWALVFISYFWLSFATGAWYITWLIFFIGVAFDNIVDAIFTIVGKKYLK